MKNHYQEISPSRAAIVIENLGTSIDGKSVIEFGASSGETLRDLQAQHACNVESFDLFPVKLDFCNSSYFNLDELDFSSIRKNLVACDVVLFLDVLEHVKEPKKIIEALFEINPDITIVMISPNFASIRMLSAWLNGYLPEEKSGFYDGTHFKWLSKKWLEKSLDTETYSIHFFNVFSKRRHINSLQRIFPNRLCSQFGAVINIQK